MRAILMTGAVALLAGCDTAETPGTPPSDATSAATVASAVAGPPVASERRTFRSWLAACDNGGDCVAIAGPVDGTSAGWLRVALSAGPEAQPTVMAGFWPGAETTGPLTLTIDGRTWTLGQAADHDGEAMGQIAPEAVADVIAALIAARDLGLTRGNAHVRLSPAGASAALLWIDEKHMRLDTPTALARQGERAASAVPAAPALPLVAPAPAASARTPPPSLSTALPAALAGREDVRACRENLRWNATLFEEVSRDRLDAATELWGVPCDAGAYNLMTRYFLTGPDGVNPRPLDFRGEGEGEPQPVLVNARYDPATATLTQLAKARGLGDCGVHQSWVWTGRGFVLSREAIMGECWGMPGDLWPTTWRTRQP